MKHSNIDLSKVIIDLNFFPKAGQQNCDDYLLEQLQRMQVVYGCICKLRTRQIAVEKNEVQDLINCLHKLIPQVTQLQEIVYQMNYTGNILNRFDFILEDMIECLIVILKDLKGVKKYSPVDSFRKIGMQDYALAW